MNNNNVKTNLDPSIWDLTKISFGLRPQEETQIVKRLPLYIFHINECMCSKYCKGFFLKSTVKVYVCKLENEIINKLSNNWYQLSKAMT